MSNFGAFESLVSSEQEVGLAKQASVDKMAAAVYDVRQALGPVLFASASVEEFRHKVAMMKHDQSLYRIVEAAGVFPNAGTMRRIVGKGSVLEREFKERIACYPGCHENEAHAKKHHKGEDKEARRYQGADADVAVGPIGAQPSGAMDEIPQGQPGMGGQVMGSRSAAHGEHQETFEDDPADFEHTSHDPHEQLRPHYAGDKDPNRPIQSLQETFQPSDKLLKPKDDWDGYRNKMDQGGPAKVKKHNFAALEFGLYTDWCAANGVSPARLSSLDVYAGNLPDEQYFRLSSAIQAAEATGVDWEHTHQPSTPKGQSKTKLKNVTAGEHSLPVDDPQHSRFIEHVPAGYGGLQDIVHHPEYKPRHEAGQHSIEDPDPTRYNDPTQDPEFYPQAVTDQSGARHYPELPAHHRPEHEGSRRQAAPDYLQKADDALSQLLNQKAEEFQETIAPLQQALVVVQQAEQLAQAQNPMSVLPPPGTVNVMPGGDQGPAGMPAPGAQDLGAAVQALAGGGGGAPGGPPGGDPSGGAAPPDQGVAPDGGMPDGSPGPPPAAAGGGLPPDQEQMLRGGRRRERGGRPKGKGATRPRQASNVLDLWNKWTQGDSTQRGGDSDLEEFGRQFNIGPKGLNQLSQHLGLPPRIAGGLVDPNKMWNNFNELSGFNGAGPAAKPKGTVAPPPIPKTKYPRPGETLDEYYSRTGSVPSTWEEAEGRRVDRHRPKQQKFSDDYPSEDEESLRYRANSHERPRWTGPQGPGPGEHEVPTHHKPQTHLVPMDDQEYATWDAPQERYHGGEHEQWAPPLVEDQSSLYMAPSEDTPHRTAGEHDYNPDNPDQTFAPARGHGWEHASGPSGPPYVRDEQPMDEHGQRRQPRHEASRRQAWSGWGPAVFPKVRQVTGWNWDSYLNGYTANRAQRFACVCGDDFPAAIGFHRCGSCGKQWNSYVIGTGGTAREAAAEKFLVREVPGRKDVIVANRRTAHQCEYCGGHGHDYTAHPEAIADVREWEQERNRQEFPFGDHQERGDELESYDTGGYEKGRNYPAHPAEEYYDHDSGQYKKSTTTLVDERTGKRYEMIDPYSDEDAQGEIDNDWPSDHHPETGKLKSTPSDWHHRDQNQRWVKS